jgi:hypothetical protein
MERKFGSQLSRSFADLVHHHVCAGLQNSGLLLSWLVTGSIWVSLVHLHVLFGALLALLLLVVFRVLDVNLLAAGFGLGVVVVGGAGGILSACHGGIFALSNDALAFDFLLLFFLFLDAVLVSVCVEVGLGLLRRELGRCRLVGIPVTISGVQESRISLFTYHLMAKRVTRGFSARICLCTFSMTGLVGGSRARASSVYSLFT